MQACELLTPDHSGTSMPLFTRPIGRLVEEKGNVAGTVYFGPTSLEALILDFGDLVSNRIDSDVPRLRNANLSIQGRIDSFVNIQHGTIPSRVVLAPTEPPLAILEGMIDGYFSNINPQFPIWSKSVFQKMVASLREHTTCAEDEWASIVCCNNLILINLTADAVHSVQRRMAQSGSTESFPSMESDLIARFLANSKRAMENLGLISPRLINLQALLSLVSSSPALGHTPTQTIM
jgi:hypothetical protein